MRALQTVLHVQASAFEAIGTDTSKRSMWSAVRTELQDARAASAAPEAQPEPQDYVDTFMDGNYTRSGLNARGVSTLAPLTGPASTLAERTEFYEAEEGGKEIDGLVKVFEVGLHQAIKEAKALGKKQHSGPEAFLSGELIGCRFTRALLKHLLGTAKEEHADAVQFEINEDLTVTLIGVVSSIVDHARYDTPKKSKVSSRYFDTTVSSLQMLLNAMGASTLTLRFAGCADEDLCRAGLRLGAALLHGGNRSVQSTIYTLLHDAVNPILPADGSEQSFFLAMKSRIRLGIKEITDRKAYLAQQVERRASFAEMSEGLSGIARDSLWEDIQRDYTSMSCVLDVLTQRLHTAPAALVTVTARVQSSHRGACSHGV